MPNLKPLALWLYTLGKQSLGLTLVWLGLVVVYWAYRAVYAGRAS